MILSRTFVSHFHVDFDLLDAGGVVHHPKYLVICERARSAYLEHIGYPVTEMWSDNIAFAVTEANARYLRPVRLGQKLTVLSTMPEVGKSRFKVTQRIVELRASDHFPLGIHSQVEPAEILNEFYQVELTLACIDIGRFKTVRLPEKFSQALPLMAGE